MSTDVVADALLGLATCESSIKSLSQILTSLHSIGLLHRLKEKADVVEALLVIASFAPFLAPQAVPAPLTTVDIDESSVEATSGHLERRAEMLRRDRLAVIGERQDETTVFTHTPALTYPSTLEGGCDDDVRPPEEVLPSCQSVSRTSSQPAPPAHLLHPVRHSELTPSASESIPLYSFLIHFPVFSAVGAKLSSVDREELFSLPAMAKWGFGNSMTTRPYPRLRLTNKGAACIVVDDDLGRLEEISKDLEEAEREIWNMSAAGMLDRKFFFVGTWNEEHVALVFSSSSSAGSGRPLCPSFQRWTAPGNLWNDIVEVYPILSHYQESAHEQQGGSRPLLGAGLFHHISLQPYNRYNQSYSIHYVTLVVPLLGSLHALMFANDFVAHYSPISLVSNGGTEHRADVRVVKMGPPALKEDGNWDGPVLRNDAWLGGLDPQFGLS